MDKENLRVVGYVGMHCPSCGHVFKHGRDIPKTISNEKGKEMLQCPWCGNIAHANGFITFTPVEQND